MTSKHRTKAILFVSMACVGMASLGLTLFRSDSDKIKVMPTAEAGVLKMNEVLPAKKQELVSYVSLQNAKLSTQERLAIAKQIKNLNSTNSTTGGMLTTEFKQSTHAKMTYRFGRRQSLSFETIKITPLLPQGFILTGRQYEGQRGEQGFDGIYLFFENPSTKARFEITQTKITKPITLIKELYNENIDGVPLRLESLSDKRGVMYYHGEFVLDDTYVIMNAKGMNLPEFMAVIIGLMDSQ